MHLLTTVLFSHRCREPTRLSGRNQRWQMQRGHPRAADMMIHHPHALRGYSVAILVTGQMGHSRKADPGQSTLPRVVPTNLTGMCATSLACRTSQNYRPRHPRALSISYQADPVLPRTYKYCSRKWGNYNCPRNSVEFCLPNSRVRRSPLHGM